MKRRLAIIAMSASLLLATALPALALSPVEIYRNALATNRVTFNNSKNALVSSCTSTMQLAKSTLTTSFGTARGNLTSAVQGALAVFVQDKAAAGSDMVALATAKSTRNATISDAISAFGLAKSGAVSTYQSAVAATCGVSLHDAVIAVHTTMVDANTCALATYHMVELQQCLPPPPPPPPLGP